MRIEVLGAFGEQQEDGSSKCFHPPGIPYPDGSKPARYLETGVDLRDETAEWAIKVGAAKPVYIQEATPAETQEASGTGKKGKGKQPAPATETTTEESEP